MDFFQALFAIDWTGIITAAVASGVGLAAVTQLLKTKWVKVPAKKYPRIVTAVLAVLVGIISTFAAGIELSSLTSFIVFVIVSFIVSGLAYDAVHGLVGEVKESPVTPEAVSHVDHVTPNTRVIIESDETATKGPEDSIEIVAQEIIDGKKADGTSWGNGAERKANLEAAGYNFDKVQAKVKELVANK